MCSNWTVTLQTFQNHEYLGLPVDMSEAIPKSSIESIEDERLLTLPNDELRFLTANDKFIKHYRAANLTYCKSVGLSTKTCNFNVKSIDKFGQISNVFCSHFKYSDFKNMYIFFRNIVPHDVLLWYLVLVRFSEIQWDLVSYSEIQWDLPRFGEIWWDFAGFGEIQWDLVKFGSK